MWLDILKWPFIALSLWGFFWFIRWQFLDDSAHVTSEEEKKEFDRSPFLMASVFSNVMLVNWLFRKLGMPIFIAFVCFSGYLIFRELPADMQKMILERLQ